MQPLLLLLQETCADARRRRFRAPPRPAGGAGAPLGGRKGSDASGAMPALSPLAGVVRCTASSAEARRAGYRPVHALRA